MPFDPLLTGALRRKEMYEVAEARDDVAVEPTLRAEKRDDDAVGHHAFDMIGRNPKFDRFTGDRSDASDLQHRAETRRQKERVPRAPGPELYAADF